MLGNRSTVYFSPSGFTDSVLICSTWSPSSQYMQDFSHLNYHCPCRIWYLFPSSSLGCYCFVSCFCFVCCFYLCLFVIGPCAWLASFPPHILPLAASSPFTPHFLLHSPSSDSISNSVLLSFLQDNIRIWYSNCFYFKKNFVTFYFLS